MNKTNTAKVALVAVVTAIVEKARAIDDLNVFQQAAAAKQLIKDDVVPFLMTIAEKLDGLTPESDLLKQLESLNKKVTALEAQAKKLTKTEKVAQ